MTKEELKQQFYKYIKDHEDYFDPREPWTERIILQIWFDCAEPREKQIQALGERCLQLQKDKGNLTDKVRELETLNEEIENYFVESAGYGRDKVRNFMDIVNNALKQKGERITDLEETIDKLREQFALRYDLEDKIKELEDKLANADYQLEGRDLEIKELKAQIEKMKCCYNCKHSRTEYEHCRTEKSEKWEIKEK